LLLLAALNGKVKVMTRIMACMTLHDEVLEVLKKKPEVDAEFLEYSLHRVPDKLKAQLQQRIDNSPAGDRILLGYGLCSYGTAGLGSKEHRLVIPRIHDCISLLMGDRKTYDQEFELFPATFYLSKGWIDQKAEPLAEYRRYQEQYDEETAAWLIKEQYSHYQRVVFLQSTMPELEKYLDYAKEVAEFLKVPLEIRQGSLRLLEKLIEGPWDREFVTTDFGETILQRSFL